MNPTAQLLEPEVRDLIASGSYRELRDALSRLDPPDVADLLRQIDPGEASIAFRILPRDIASDIFSNLDPDTQEALIGELGEAPALRLVESLDPDDRAALLDELPDQVARRLLTRLSPKDRRITQQILGYPDESVGRLMTPDYVRVRRTWTVGHALEHIRAYGRDAETIDWIYVIDDAGRLIDDLHIRRLLLAPPTETIESLMDERFIALKASDDQEEAVRMMNRYDRSALPVVDSRGVLLGIVTHDDVADVAQEEATEDIHKLGGMEALEGSYTQTPIREMLRKRGGILAALLIAESLTVTVLGSFEDNLAAVAALIAFIPLIIASGGNTGTQGATLIVRALSLEQVRPQDWKGVLRKELMTSLALGTLLGTIGFIEVLIFNAIGFIQTDVPMRIGTAVALSMLAVVVWASVVGSLFPLLVARLGFDPAAISSPFVATLMDVTGLLIYMVTATVILHSVLP